MTPEAAAALLNVDLHADRRDIEAAYRRRARLTHPDRSANGVDDFVRAGQARDVLLARLDSPVPVVPMTTPIAVPVWAPARATLLHSGRATILAAAALLLVVLGLVIAMGMHADVAETNPSILPVKSVSGIETHCGGSNACWVWRIVDTRACRGTVVVDFYTHQHDAQPTETVAKKISVRANVPAYVSVSTHTFTEPYAYIAQYDC